MKRQQYFGQIALVLAAALFALPFIPLILASFSFRWHWPDVLPSMWMWEARGTTPFPVGWDYLFSPVSGLGPAFANTVGIGVATAFLATLIALPAARVLARYNFPGKEAVEFFLLVPVIVPQIAVGIGMLMLFIRLGITRSYVGIVLAHLVPTVPYAVRILTSSFQNLDIAYEEQARTLGADRISVLRYVVLPLIMPGLLTALFFGFLISSNVFLLTFLISGGRIETLPTLLFQFIESGAPLDSTTAGLVLIVSIPGLVFLLLSDLLARDGRSIGRTPVASVTVPQRPGGPE